MKKILLMGNPNVGKSVIFSRLTGVHVISSNYPGTTVSLTSGTMKIGAEPAELIDAPGSYSLEPTSEAEEIALRLLGEADIVVNVVDATNLERNLYLTLQMLERDIPVIVALNLWDDTKHRGINIDVRELAHRLGIPVIPTSGITGQGIAQLVEKIPQAVSKSLSSMTREERWAHIGTLVSHVQQMSHRHHRWYERLEDASVRPSSGIPIAIAVLIVSFIVIRFLGESCINYLFDPFFNKLWLPVLVDLSASLGGGGFLHDILVGKLIGGEIHFIESFGLLSSGLYVPFAMVLPYIVSFYFVLGFLEDTGYLPRLAVLLDTAMHRIGLHGYAIVPTLLGLGCNVPAIIATRILESERERFIAATLTCIAIPCISSQAMIFGLVGKFGGGYVAIVYGTLFLIWLTLGMILNRFMKGISPELLIEIPPYRMPPWHMTFQKLWMRMKEFFVEALPIILFAVLMINVLFTLQIFDALSSLASPVVKGILGLPEDSVMAILLGILRKDAALGLLATTALTAKQMVIGCVVVSVFFPCIASIVVLFRELRWRKFLVSTALMIATALIAGGVLNILL